jgi:hypothetical protein
MNASSRSQRIEQQRSTFLNFFSGQQRLCTALSRNTIRKLAWLR